MSLGELELYIQKNKHLPEVPTTEQVNEEGIEIAQMNVVLLKKVEELTLYIIQLQKELITAQESLNSAEAGNNQLNERLLLLEKQIELIQQVLMEKTNDSLKK
jgi:hypothetical protein